MKRIIIPYDFSNGVASISHEEVENMMSNEVEKIHTHSIHFFNFSTLDRGYDVEIIKRNGDFIILSELLENDGRYTSRIIRKGHNVLRLFLAGEFKFQSR